MSSLEQRFSCYPSKDEVDEWANSLWQRAMQEKFSAEILPENGVRPPFGFGYSLPFFHYVRFQRGNLRPFYGYWQVPVSLPAPLIIHLPGYGAEMAMLPELAAQGYAVLHINPQGYMTPNGEDSSQRNENGIWPVLPDTALGKENAGYQEWLLDVIAAVQWGMSTPEAYTGRVSFIGTSQGGGGALLLGSLFQNHGTRCVCADVPFLTNFPLADFRGAYRELQLPFRQIDETIGWRRMGFVDTLSHAHRLTMPVLLTSGGKDDVCPPETIASLFEKLPGTRSLSHISDLIHMSSREFLSLVTAWLRLYA